MRDTLNDGARWSRLLIHLHLHVVYAAGVAYVHIYTCIIYCKLMRQNFRFGIFRVEKFSSCACMAIHLPHGKKLFDHNVIFLIFIADEQIWIYDNSMFCLLL